MKSLPDILAQKNKVIANLQTMLAAIKKATDAQNAIVVDIRAIIVSHIPEALKLLNEIKELKQEQCPNLDSLLTVQNDYLQTMAMSWINTIFGNKFSQDDMKMLGFLDDCRMLNIPNFDQCSAGIYETYVRNILELSPEEDLLPFWSSSGLEAIRAKILSYVEERIITDSRNLMRCFYRTLIHQLKSDRLLEINLRHASVIVETSIGSGAKEAGDLEQAFSQAKIGITAAYQDKINTALMKALAKVNESNTTRQFPLAASLKITYDNVLEQAQKEVENAALQGVVMDSSAFRVIHFNVLVGSILAEDEISDRFSFVQQLLENLEKTTRPSDIKAQDDIKKQLELWLEAIRKNYKVNMRHTHIEYNQICRLISMCMAYEMHLSLLLPAIKFAISSILRCYVSLILNQDQIDAWMQRLVDAKEITELNQILIEITTNIKDSVHRNPYTAMRNLKLLTQKYLLVQEMVTILSRLNSSNSQSNDKLERWRAELKSSYNANSANYLDFSEIDNFVASHLANETALFNLAKLSVLNILLSLPYIIKNDKDRFDLETISLNKWMQDATQAKTCPDFYTLAKKIRTRYNNSKDAAKEPYMQSLNKLVSLLKNATFSSPTRTLKSLQDNHRSPSPTTERMETSATITSTPVSKRSSSFIEDIVRMFDGVTNHLKATEGNPDSDMESVDLNAGTPVQNSKA